MNFIQKLFLQPAINAATRAASIYNQGIFKYLTNNSVLWVDAEQDKYVSEGYYLNPDVYAVINTIVRLASVAPLNLYKVKDQKSLRQYKSHLKTIPSPEADPVKFRKHINELKDLQTKSLEEVFQHKILDRLENPNEYQSKGEFLENLYGFKLIAGEAIILKERAKIGTPEIMALYHLPPQNTNILSGGIDKPISKYVLGYLREDEVSFDPADIIHNRSWSLDYSAPGSHLRGISPLKSAIRALTMGNKGREAETAMLQNRGADVLVGIDPVGLKQQPTTEQLGKIKDDFNATNRGIENKGKANVAVGTFNVHQIGMNAKDLGVEEAIRLSKEDICKVYGISPILLASTDASTYNNYKEAKKAAITQAVIPLLLSVRDSFNKDLLPEFEKQGGYMMDFDLGVFTELQDDREKLVGYLKEAHWLTPNQKLVEMGFGESPDPLMNKIYFPSGLVPIEQINSTEILPDLPITEDY